jgi:hypothetical protein
MRELMEARLNTLKAEFSAGQEVLTDLETRQANVRNTLLRISGAMQVLEELLREKDDARKNSAASMPQDQEFAVG